MKPRPDVIFLVNNDDCPIDRYAPPIPANAPDNNTPAYLIRATGKPAASASSGFSPTDRSRNPQGDLYKSYQISGTSAKALNIGRRSIRCSLVICGVEPEDKKKAPLRKAGIPIIRI